jgi:hypothetical protein
MRRSTDNNDTKRENGEVLLVFEMAIHRHPWPVVSLPLHQPAAVLQHPR